MRPIPMVDLGVQYERLKPEIDAAIAEVMAGTRYILGPNVQALESELADFLGVAHAVSCASGTDALHLALRAAGIGPGDEVITSPFTFIATAEAICYCGAEPVFVDIDPRTFNLDPDGVAEAIGERTRAILPVHLFGQPADMAALSALAEARGLILIEDCAQSFGATHEGRQTGSIGRAGAFSFFPSKNLGACGDGGLITTSDDELADEIRMLRNHGRRVDGYQHEVVGYNSRLDELQAAILRVKLGHIEEFNRQRRRVAAGYGERLSDTALEMPFEDGLGRHVYHQFTMLVPEGRRDELQAALSDASIASAVYYPTPLHRQPAFSGYSRAGSLAHSESVAERCLSLPIFPEMTEEQIDRVADTLKAAL
ncbi:MAG: DegT/DnrJ/EryC1/StrS family aminotransferase [Wenzhouxiangella sp.]|nr:DegT/DnrJ/EryC1/StrS family aminotransferase [Wenzhouxiangella sp.]